MYPVCLLPNSNMDSESVLFCKELFMDSLCCPGFLKDDPLEMTYINQANEEAS